MDNLCHTLTGAAFGEAGLRRRTRFGNVTLMMAANLPDIDVLVFATEVPAVAFRRGWTHGSIAQALLPVALTAAMLLVARLCPDRDRAAPARPGWILLLAYIGVLSHVGLDLLNSYGLRLFAPFDWRWFYGDTLFIIDPWLWLILGAGIGLARFRGAVFARHALALAAVYIIAMSANARISRAAVLDEWRATRGGPPSSLMVGPAAATPFRRQIIVDAGLSYETGTLTWFPLRITLDRAIVPKHDRDPRVLQARATPNIRAFLIWARFPFWTLEPVPGGTRVTVGDMRFTGRGPRFQQSVVVEGTGSAGR